VVSKYRIKQVVSLTLLILWILMIITGTLLFISKEFRKELKLIERKTLKDIHIYVGFLTIGVSIIHIILNIRALMCYLGLGI